MIDKKISGGKRIALNTVVSYTRTIIGIVLVLFSSRWTLQSLGVQDYGLYNLVGSILLVVVFLNTVLSNGDARFFSFAIGKGNYDEINRIFNTSLSLHLLMPLIIVIVGIFIGEPSIRYILVVPPDRMETTIWAFRITMLSSFVSMATIPFSTIFIAYQNILEYSIISLIQTILIFLSAYSLRFFDCDKLLVYTSMVALSQIVTNIIQVALSLQKYKNIRVNKAYFFIPSISKSILKYSFWNMLGDLGHLVRTQGVAVIVNLFFGPSGNAALGIANQVAMQACNLTNSMSSATSPELYRRVGEGNMGAAKKLANYSSKIGLFFMFILCIPISYNIGDILRLWLGVVPDGTASLCISFIIMFIIEKMTIGQHALLRAINKISLVNSLIMVFYCLSVVFPFCGLLNLGIIGIGISCVLSMLLTRISVLYCVNKYTDFDINGYLTSIVFPLLGMIVFSILGWKLYNLINVNNVVDLFILSGLLFILSIIVSFYILFNTDEKKEIKNILITRF